MNKKLIYIGVVVLAVVLLLFVMWPSTKQADASIQNGGIEPSISNEDLLDLIQDYNSITDQSQQITVWREMLKACPFWVDFLTIDFNSGNYDKAREIGMTLDDMFTDFAIKNIENGEDILLVYANCDNSTIDLDNLFNLQNLRF